MHRRSQLATALLLVVVVAGCSNGSAGDTVDAEAPRVPQRGEVDDVEPPSGALPADEPPSDPSVPDAIPAAARDPTDAMTCDGGAVLCVDASAVGDSPDGTADLPFRTVSEALDAAGDGVTVQIAAGTYPEALVLSSRHDVALVGGFTAGGRFAERDPAVHETVLVGNGAAPVIEVSASSDIVIEGLRITGGGGSNRGGSNWSGGGVLVDGESTGITIFANRIDANAVDQGDDPSNTIGGGIATYGTDVTILANLVAGNRAGRGSGIAAFGTTVIDGNIVRDNVSVGDHGGGLYLYGSPTVTGNLVEGNEVGVDLGYGWGGGIIVFGEDTVATLRRNEVTGNLAPSAGAGVFIDDGAEATLVGELYHANRCAHDGGQGAFIDSGRDTPTTAVLVHVTIAAHDCPAPALGGNAVLVTQSDTASPAPVVSVADSILWGNAGFDVFSVGSMLTVTTSLTEQVVRGAGNRTGDPSFADPVAGDFALAAGSPATGLGHAGDLAG